MMPPSVVILEKVDTVSTLWNQAVDKPRLARRHVVAPAVVHVCER